MTPVGDLGDFGAHRRGESYDLFRSRLRIAMGLDALVGLTLLVAPGLLSDALGSAPGGEVWQRLAGLALLLLVLAQAPAALFPAAARFLALHAILTRLCLAVFLALCAGGFLWLAAAEALLFVVLLRARMAGLRADLDTRP